MERAFDTERSALPAAIVRAEPMGYCMGVRRAVETAYKALDDYPGKRVRTLGPLIHNRTALESLAGRGVAVLPEEGIAGLDPDDVVVIRAHGVSPDVKERLSARGCAIVDATCPRVMRNQRQAARLAAEGFAVIIAGDKNHGEVTGIAGCAIDSCGRNASLLVENRADAERLAQEFSGGVRPVPEKAVLISQTTISPGEYDAIACALRKAVPALQVLDTICPATTERQNALKKLRGSADGVLIIGGRNSANTRRLLMTAKAIFPHAALIETADEIPSEFFLLQRIGLSAGASTPDEVIDAVEARLDSRQVAGAGGSGTA